MIEHLWNAAEAAGLDGLDLLAYRSNLLGRDRSVCNWGGGNTSMKLNAPDFRGRQQRIMWVKGSGSDLQTITAAGFTGLRMDDVQPLLERESMSDAEMVNYLLHCFVEPGRPRPSIETLLHAFLPFDHVDHTHPDAIIALCCTPDGQAHARRIWGDTFVWAPYIRPGFALSRMIALGVRDNPRAQLVLMGKHGLVTWGDTAAGCYATTITTINTAAEYILARRNGRASFGGVTIPALSAERRHELLATALPTLRGALHGSVPADEPLDAPPIPTSPYPTMVLRYTDRPAVLDFVNSQNARTISQVGAACPDHLVHTKHRPLFVDWSPDGDADSLLRALRSGIDSYVAWYRSYYAENAASLAAEGAEYPIDPPGPRVILIPGLGMLTTGKEARLADIAAQLYERAIEVMRGADALGGFISLSDAEAFAVEYWPLERYKLQLAPPPRELSGKVALVTGAAGGIGAAICRRLAAEGAHVVLADINAEGAQTVARELEDRVGVGRALALTMNVTDEASVQAAFRAAVLRFGGVDIVINNAGLASSHPITDTTLDEWNRNMGVLGTGYFLVAREGFRILQQQGQGGALVFVVSKNALAAGKNAAAYSAAKAAELHLARCLAEEGGQYGIRVNSVLPDAVLQGSQIWNSGWREERARAYGIAPDQLESYYRNRTTLKVSVFPDDIAEAVAFLAGPRAAKTTGGVITVDGGVPTAYVR